MLFVTACQTKNTSARTNSSKNTTFLDIKKSEAINSRGKECHKQKKKKKASKRFYKVADKHVRLKNEMWSKVEWMGEKGYLGKSPYLALSFKKDSMPIFNQLVIDENVIRSIGINQNQRQDMVLLTKFVVWIIPYHTNTDCTYYKPF